MNNSDFNNEMNYGITMSYVKKLKKAGIITADEYNKIDTIMLQKYRPILGRLLSGTTLT